jgi:hypothetical protein
VTRQPRVRTWSKPLATSAVRPRHLFFMDRRVLIVCCFTGLVATFAFDFRWQLLFGAVTVILGLAGVAAWRRNPYLIDELQAEFGLPHGGPDDASEET